MSLPQYPSPFQIKVNGWHHKREANIITLTIKEISFPYLNQVKRKEGHLRGCLESHVCM